MSAFTPYPKMPDSVGAWALSDAEVRETAKLRWVATEKVHGAHLCVTLTPDAILVGKRKRALAEDEVFFAHPRAVGPHTAALRRLFELVRKQHEADSVVVYGELFGGAYPHPAVDGVADVHPVQTGVYYAPDVHFAAFDVGIHSSEGVLEMLAFDRALALLEQADVPSVPVCGTGTLTEMLALDVRFATTLPARFGLPPLPDNWAEGLVVRPASAALDRPLLLKRKHPAFEESIYHQAQRWPASSSHSPSPLAQAETLVGGLMNANRLDSAISKIGHPTTEALREEVAIEVVRDVRETVEADHGAVLVALSEEEQVLLWTVARESAGAAVSEHATPPVLDDTRFMVDLVVAFIRGRLPQVAEAPKNVQVQHATQAGLRLHKFKRKSGPPRVTTVLSVLEGLRPTKLLDIGSGRGAFLWPLLDRFPALDVTALDALEHRVRDIQAVNAGGVPRLKGVLGDTEALPFGDNAFDVVTILEVLEHLADPAAAAREVVRVGKDFVVASVPSQPDDNPEHIRLFTVATLTALFEEAGARRVQIHHVLNHMIAVVRCPP